MCDPTSRRSKPPKSTNTRLQTRISPIQVFLESTWDLLKKDLDSYLSLTTLHLRISHLQEREYTCRLISGSHLNKSTRWLSHDPVDYGFDTYRTFMRDIKICIIKHLTNNKAAWMVVTNLLLGNSWNLE